MNLTLALLAGGLATRMQPLTKHKPKSLLEVADDYFISHQLRYFKQQGITKVVLCVGHFGEQIEAIIGDGNAYGLEVEYSWDGPQLLGTGGALKKALPKLGEVFFILYGDSYPLIDLADMKKVFQQNNEPAMMAIFKNKNQWERSNVILEKNLIIQYNKSEPKIAMDYIDYGLSIMIAKELEDFPAEKNFDLARLYQHLAQEKKLSGYEVFERFYEIGSMEGLQETNHKISQGLGLSSNPILFNLPPLR